MRSLLSSRLLPVANLATDLNYWRAMDHLLELEKEYKGRVDRILKGSPESSFVLVPGFLRDSRVMMPLGKELAQHGSVYHTSSLTKKDWFKKDAPEHISDMTKKLIEEAHHHNPDGKVVVIGHSLGGALGLDAATQSKPPVAGVVQLATPNSRAPIMDVPFINQVPILKGWGMPSNGQERPGPPVLLLRTEQDTMIPPGYQNLPSGTREGDIHSLSGGDHYNVLFEPALIDLIVRITLLQFLDPNKSLAHS